MDLNYTLRRQNTCIMIMSAHGQITCLTRHVIITLHVKFTYGIYAVKAYFITPKLDILH